MYFPSFSLENKLFGIHQTSFLPVEALAIKLLSNNRRAPSLRTCPHKRVTMINGSFCNGVTGSLSMAWSSTNGWGHVLWVIAWMGSLVPGSVRVLCARVSCTFFMCQGFMHLFCGPYSGPEWPASRHRIASVFASWERIAEDFRSENAHRQDFCIASHRHFRVYHAPPLTSHCCPHRAI